MKEVIPKLEDSDIPNIVELLQTLSTEFVAETYDVTAVQIVKFIAIHGYNIRRLRDDFRHDWITNNPNATTAEACEAFNCQRNAVHIFKRKHRLAEVDRLRYLVTQARHFLLDRKYVTVAELEKWDAGV